MHPLQPHSPHDDEPQAPWRSPWSMDDDAPPLRAYRQPSPPRPELPRAPEPVRRVAPPPAPARIDPREAPPPGQWNRLIVVTFMAFMGLFMAWAYLRDEERPQDSDLRPEAPCLTGVRPAALELWQSALQSATFPGLSDAVLKPTWEWDTPTLSRTVEANRTTWSALESALRESDWQPQNPAWRSPEVGGHDQWEALGTACNALIAYLSRKGEEKSAFQAALDVATLGRRLQTISSWPTYYNHGLRLQQRASESLAELLRSTQLDGRTLNVMQATFERSQPEDAQLRDALNGFYQFERVLFTGLRKDDPWDMLPGGLAVQTQQRSRWFFKPYATLELFTKAFRGLKSEVVKPPYAWADHLVRVVGPAGRPLDSSGALNYAGGLYANQRLWPYAQLLENHALQRTRHLLVLTLFAVRSYGANQSRAPLALADLKPLYFTSLPVDPFSGESLGYDSARGLIFSVGLDYKSEKGNPLPMPMSDPYEPTLRIR